MRPVSPADDLVFGKFLEDLYHSIRRSRLYPVPLAPSLELTRQIAAVNGLDCSERFRERVGRCRYRRFHVDRYDSKNRSKREGCE